MQWPLEAALLVLGFVRVMTNREPCVSMMYDRSLLKFVFRFGNLIRQWPVLYTVFQDRELQLCKKKKNDYLTTIERQKARNIW